MGRRMAGARALWRANGMKNEQMGKPLIAIVNSFTQFVPGHVHLHDIGQQVKAEIEKMGCFAAEFNTIAIDDGIAMGHDGMLYSLPSRDLIADSVEYMVNAHKADAMVCISNCDKITPGMLMAAMRLNIPTVFVSGGPMEAGELDGKQLDLVDAMVQSADENIPDQQIQRIENAACPTCGSCSGMFTANSMNCLNEAIGLALPGNGTIAAGVTGFGRTQERVFQQAIIKSACCQGVIDMGRLAPCPQHSDADGPVQQAGIEERQAVMAGQGFGYRSLAGRCRAINCDDHNGSSDFLTNAAINPNKAIPAHATSSTKAARLKLTHRLEIRSIAPNKLSALNTTLLRRLEILA